MEEPEDAVTQDMFHPVPPAGDEALEHPHEVVGHAADVLARDPLQRVPEGYPVGITRIKVDDLIRVLFGDEGQQAVDKVAMRVQDSHAVALPDIV